MPSCIFQSIGRGWKGGLMLKVPIYTSRKHGEKELQSFSHCGSFDHHGLQSLNDYKILFFILRLQKLMFWGVWYTIGKVFSRRFQRYITSPKIPKVSVGKSRKTNMQLFSDCRAWWSKEPQWENDYGSFLPCFLLVLASLKLKVVFMLWWCKDVGWCHEDVTWGRKMSTPIILLPNGTLQDCHPTLPNDVGQCKPLQDFAHCQSWD